MLPMMQNITTRRHPMWFPGNILRPHVDHNSVLKQNVTDVSVISSDAMLAMLNTFGIQFVKRMVSALLSRYHFCQRMWPYVRNVSHPVVSR